MRIAGIYSFNGGREFLTAQFAPELQEVERVVAAVDGKPERFALDRAFKAQFETLGWHTHRVLCDYPTQYYIDGYQVNHVTSGAFREMDFVKGRVGVEVQFGKYAFMVYNVCAKMTIFHNLDVIDVGVEIVPVKEFAGEMSTGVLYFEQFVWNLGQRGVSNIDIPVLILGINR